MSETGKPKKPLAVDVIAKCPGGTTTLVIHSSACLPANSLLITVDSRLVRESS